VKLSFVVRGPPVPWERVDFGKSKDGKRKGFTPKKTADYEKLVGFMALAARTQTGPRPWPWKDQGASFGLVVRVFRSRSAGDWDNYGKAISDACNGVLWVDDKQVVNGSVEIIQCAKGEERAEVEVLVIALNG
jgi:Holliday junction resolvase RusA-like endonuclease